MPSKAKIGVLGASGYTGSELVRLLLRHPRAELALLTADRRAGQEMRDVFPQFAPFDLPKLVALDGIDWLAQGLDVVFCGLNPAASAAESGHNFSNATNRFWRVLHLAGFTDICLRPQDERRLPRDCSWYQQV